MKTHQNFLHLNERDVKLLWRVCNSVFDYSNWMFDEIDESDEIAKFRKAYYDFLKACNELYDYAESLPF